MYNKKSRVADLKLDASRILDKGEIRKAEASSLRGRLNLAQGQMFGCLLKPAMQALGSWAEGHQQASRDQLAQVMVYVAMVLVHAPVQIVSIHDRRPPALLFTDGAYEPDGQGRVAGAGACFVDPATKTERVADVSVPEELLCLWKSQGRRQLIMHLELLPVLVSLHRLGPSLRGCRILIFVDNNGARDALIKGTSPIADVYAILAQ